MSKVVNLDLTKVDGNAFALMGAFQRQAEVEGWTSKEIADVIDECTSGNYDHLVWTLIKVTV